MEQIQKLEQELEALRAERDAATSRAKQYLLNSYEETAAWRTATGCDTPEETAEVRRRWEAEDAEQASELARLRKLEAAVLDADRPVDPILAGDVLPSRFRRVRAAIAACRSARKPPGDGEGK